MGITLALAFLSAWTKAYSGSTRANRNSGPYIGATMALKTRITASS